MNTEQRDDPIRAAAELLAHHGIPGVGQRLLTAHAADTSGHCRTCRLSSGAFPVSPCNLWLIGDEVQKLTTPDPTTTTPPTRDDTPDPPRPDSTIPATRPAAPAGSRPSRGRRRPTRLRES